MIKRIFFDMDECVLHTAHKLYEGETASFYYVGFDKEYPVFVREGAKMAIEFAMSLVGKYNVYILTQGEGEYARSVIKQTDFGIEPDHIIPREIIKMHYVNVGYGSATIPHELSDKHNVLIDNLPYAYNQDKVALMGIRKDRYIEVEDFYGVTLENDKTFETVIEKLKEINEINEI